MKNKLWDCLIIFAIAFLGAACAILIVGLFQYPGAVKVEDVIGTLGTIIGLILAGIGIFITIYSTVAIGQIDKRLKDEGQKIEDAMVAEYRLKLNGLANGLIWYNKAQMDARVGRNPKYVQLMVQEALSHYPELPNTRMFVIGYFLGFVVQELSKLRWVLPKDVSEISSYLKQCLDILDGAIKTDGCVEIIGATQYLRALVYGLLGCGEACIENLEKAVRLNPNVMAHCAVDYSMAMVLYCFAGGSSVNNNSLRIIRNCFKVPDFDSVKDYANSLLDKEDSTGQAKFTALLYPNKEYNIPSYYPCNVYTHPAGDIRSPERLISFASLIPGQRATPFAAKGTKGEDLADVLCQHFLIVC